MSTVHKSINENQPEKDQFELCQDLNRIEHLPLDPTTKMFLQVSLILADWAADLTAMYAEMNLPEVLAKFEGED